MNTSFSTNTLSRRAFISLLAGIPLLATPQIAKAATDDTLSFGNDYITFDLSKSKSISKVEWNSLFGTWQVYFNDNNGY